MEENIMGPEGNPEKDIKAVVELTPAQLYRFNLYHCYRNSANGFFGILLGLMCILYGIGFHSALGAAKTVIITGLGLMFWLYNPISLYLRSKNRFLRNDALKKPMDYIFNNQGMTLSQEGQSETVEWDNIYRVIETKECLYFFFTRIHANIVPKKALGDGLEGVYALVRGHVDKAGIRLKKENR